LINVVASSVMWPRSLWTILALVALLQFCTKERSDHAALSDVVILDAQNFVGEPVATIRLPVRVPFGFHGGWAPDRITVVE
jgi:hypothetical protein